MSSRLWTDRSVVYIITVGPDFRPQSPWSLPETFLDARVKARNVPLQDARAMVRTLNKTALEAWQFDHDGWDRQWAVAVACVRSKGFDRLIRVVSARPATAKEAVA